MAEGYNWFSYLQLPEKLQVDKTIYGVKYSKRL